MALNEVLEIVVLKLGQKNLTIGEILFFGFVLVAGRFILFIFGKFLARQFKANRIDAGRRYTLYQIATYLIYVTAIALGLDSIGIKITVLIAGSTALLVGLGLGLQDSFKDLVAGFVILAERSLAVGDILEVDGMVGKVQSIGLRTTTVINRDDICLIVPNQKLTAESVINWSQNGQAARFSVNVGVAYGSDTRLVEQLLLDIANAHSEVLKLPSPFVQFADFGDNALIFKLLFFSENLFRVEKIKSDLRFEIDKTFKNHNISIPFPQRDLWIRNPGALSS